MSEEVIRVIVVEDHTIVREGLISLLDAAHDMEVMAYAADGLTALHKIKELQPDVVVCDLGLPGLSGLEVMERSRQNGSTSQFLALSMYHDRVWIQRSINAGAKGYLAKGSGIKDLLGAIRKIKMGELFFTPDLQAVHTSSKGSDAILSNREKEVLTLLAQGHSSREMSDILHISKRTVEHHRAHIMDKLRVYDVAGLTRYAIRNGYVDVHLK